MSEFQAPEQAATPTETPAETTTTQANEAPHFGDGADDSLTQALSAKWDELHAEPKQEPAAEQENSAENADVESDQSPTEGDSETEPSGHSEPSIDAPQSWSAEAKAKWGDIPRELQEVIAERERQAHEQITRQGEVAKQFETVTSFLEQKYPGSNHAATVQNLVRAQAYLESDPVAALKWLADSYKVDLAKTFGQPQQTDGYDDDNFFQDPRFDQVNSQLEQTRRELQEARSQIQELGGFVKTQQQQQYDSMTKETTAAIETATKELPYFNELRNEITEEVSFIKSRNPEMKAADVLKKAHERAVNNSPTYRAKIEQERKAKEADEAAKKAAKAAKTQQANVKGSTKGEVKADRWDDDAAWNARYDRIVAS